jgi:hypothetical protein
MRRLLRRLRDHGRAAPAGSIGALGGCPGDAAIERLVKPAGTAWSRHKEIWSARQASYSNNQDFAAREPEAVAREAHQHLIADHRKDGAVSPSPIDPQVATPADGCFLPGIADGR